MTEREGYVDPIAPKRFSVDNYAYAAAPRLGFKGWLRWVWRQVTSMRLALVLLLLLGLAAIPGSLIPQRPQDAGRAAEFVEANPTWGPLLERLGFLDVFGSAWFTAIYVLLFVSLIGCIVPRVVVHAKAVRAPVAPVPSSLKRFEPTSRESALSVDDAVAAVTAWAAGRGEHGSVAGRLAGYRVRVDERGAENSRGAHKPRSVAIALEQGHVREWGNLVFHLALVGVLLALAYGSAFTHRGQVVLVEGETFTNAVASYDSFSAGGLFDEASLDPFTMTLTSFEPEWDVTGRATDFTAFVDVSRPGESATAATVKVNSPLDVDGGKIYLQGNGYAPVITVRDSDGNLAFTGPVPFLPQDDVYTSNGVVKVPDVTSGPQIGIVATLFPTAAADDQGNVVSVNPQIANPIIFLTAWKGDLGLDDGIPQNVYQLDETNMEEVLGDDGEPLLIDLGPGDTITLPDGLGTVTWESTRRFVALDLRADPSLPWVLGTTLAAMFGISVSLFAPRRRLWLIVSEGPRTLVDAALLAPSHDEAAHRALATAMAIAAGAPVERPTAGARAHKEEW